MHSGNPYACFLANPLRIGTGILTMLGLVVAGWPSPAAAKSTAAAGATADEDLEDIGARATGSGMTGVANPNDIGAIRLSLATASLTERYELYTGAELGPDGHFSLRGGAMDSRTSTVALALGYRRLTDAESLTGAERPGWKTEGQSFENRTEHQGLFGGIAYPFLPGKGAAAVNARYDWYDSELVGKDGAFNFGVSAAFKVASVLTLAGAIDNLLETDFRDTQRELRVGARWDAGTYFSIEGNALAPVAPTWSWQDVDWRLGSNVGVAKFLSLHAGYANNHTRSWVTGGLGLTSEKADLDYGMRVRVDQPRNNVHTLDLRVRL